MISAQFKTNLFEEVVTNERISIPLNVKFEKIGSFQTRNIPHFGHEKIIERILSNCNHLVINPIIGPKKSGDINKEILGQIMNEIASKTGCKGKNLWQPIRFIITGQEHGPDLASFMSIIGIDECINRFNNVS